MRREKRENSEKMVEGIFSGKKRPNDKSLAADVDLLPSLSYLCGDDVDAAKTMPVERKKVSVLSSSYEKDVDAKIIHGRDTVAASLSTSRCCKAVESIWEIDSETKGEISQ